MDRHSTNPLKQTERTFFCWFPTTNRHEWLGIPASTEKKWVRINQLYLYEDADPLFIDMSDKEAFYFGLVSKLNLESELLTDLHESLAFGARYREKRLHLQEVNLDLQCLLSMFLPRLNNAHLSENLEEEDLGENLQIHSITDSNNWASALIAAMLTNIGGSKKPKTTVLAIHPGEAGDPLSVEINETHGLLVNKSTEVRPATVVIIDSYALGLLPIDNTTQLVFQTLHSSSRPGFTLLYRLGHAEVWVRESSPIIQWVQLVFANQVNKSFPALCYVLQIDDWPIVENTWFPGKHVTCRQHGDDDPTFFILWRQGCSVCDCLLMEDLPDDASFISVECSQDALGAPLFPWGLTMDKKPIGSRFQILNFVFTKIWQ